MTSIDQIYLAALLDATKARALFDDSKGGNVRGITENHRFELASVINYAERAKRENDMVDIALQAIMSALYPNGEIAWNEWSRYAAAGEWF